MPVSLAAIRQMIKNRQYADARSALEAYLRDNPKSAEGWFLLSLADETTPKRLAAARKAAKLAPKNARVQARLIKLQKSPKSKSNRGRVVLLIVAVLALVILGIAFIPRIIQQQNRPTATVQAAVSTSVTETPIVTATAETPTSIPALLTTEEIVASPDISATPPPTNTATLTATITPSPSPTTQPPTIAPTVTNAPPTLPPPTIVPPTIAPTTMPPATVIPPPAAVLNEAQEVGTGQMWIVAMTRSAEGLISELGGFINAAPPGSHWVLVEMFMICSGTTNCGPQPSALQIVGPSRTPYGVPEGFEVQPTFGPSAYTEGQVWGYLGFIVPDSESPLTLVLNQSGQQYAFDLQ